MLKILKSQCKFDLHLRSNKGITLIEILIVLGLIAAITAYTVPRLSTGDKVRSTIRKMTVIMRQVQTEARLRSTIHRMVIQIPEEDTDLKHTYWIEQATNKTVSIVFEEALAKKDAFKEDQEAPPSQFQQDGKFTKDKVELPDGYVFESVEFPGQTVTSGKAYIYFFPQGLVTKALIHITNRDKINYTLAINPLTGQAAVINEKKSLKDVE